MNPGGGVYGSVLVDLVRAVFSVVTALVCSVYDSFMGTFFWFLPGRYKCVHNDIILITGGGKGVGRLIAVELAKHKPKRIIIWGRHGDTLAATASVITRMKIPCDYSVCDVSNRQQVEEKAEAIIAKYGGVSIIVNNAGVTFGNTILESSPEEMEYTVQVNTLAHFWTTRAFLPIMSEKNHGHLVFMNSLLGLMPLAGAADYSCSKFGSAGFSESLQAELAAQDSDIHITTIHPYLMDNDMFAGCKTRFPCLFPALDPSYVAWKTVDAILSNQQVIIIPRLMYTFPILKSLLPVNALLAIYKFTGVDRTMEEFHGRIKKRS